MSYSYSTTESTTFTVTHAKHIAAKVATDLKRMQRFYGKPSDTLIDQYEREIVELLKHGYLKKVTYGFQKNDNWIEPTLIYTSRDLSLSESDDPGKIRPGKNIDNASFASFLEYSDTWNTMSSEEQKTFKENLPFQRTTGDTPGVTGYLEDDRTYSSGGRSLARSSVRSYT